MLGSHWCHTLEGASSCWQDEGSNESGEWFGQAPPKTWAKLASGWQRDGHPLVQVCPRICGWGGGALAGAIDAAADHLPVLAVLVI